MEVARMKRFSPKPQANKTTTGKSRGYSAIIRTSQPKPSPAYWPEKETLFHPLPASAKKILAKFPIILEKVWPLKKRHRDQLPQDIALLSRKLTSDRKALEKNYWSRPENISAYLYYFLPWNLLRLLALLPGLPLGNPEKTDAEKIPVIYDAGSGPLTLPIALWLAKPEWRNAPIRIMAQDKVGKPLELGKAIMEEMTRLNNNQPWEIAIATGSIFALPEMAKKQPDFEKTFPFLIGGANILNELSLPASFQKYRPTSLDDVLEQLDEEPAEEEEKFYALLNCWQPLLRNGKTRLLLVEPGTRLGGTSIMLMRKAASLFNLTPLSPCTHALPCPLTGAFSASSAAYQKTWCHFTFPVGEAPGWLVKLTRESGLEKASLSLSFALFGKGQGNTPGKSGLMPARVLSGSFKIPDMIGMARYACSEKGLLLLKNGISLQRGGLTEADFPENPERDKKSGAFILPSPASRKMPGKEESTHTEKKDSRRNKE